MQKIKITYNPFSLGSIERVAPTTSAQREMWTTLMLEKESTKAYNEVVRLTLKSKSESDINVNVLEYSFLEIVSRHDALRSCFSNDGQSLFVKQFDRSYYAQFFKFIDLSFFQNPKEEFQVHLNKLMGTELNIASDQLFSMQVFKTEANCYEIIFFAHHIVCDGWSYAIILSEFSSIYNSKSEGRFYDLDIPLQFSEYAYIEKENGANENARNYWQQEFFDFLSKEDLPTIKERSYSRSFLSDRYDHQVSPELVTRFKKLCAKNGCSFYTGLISGFALLLTKIVDLKKITNGEVGDNYDLVIGLSSAAQPALDNNHIVGHLVNLLPLRIQKPKSLTLKQFLKNTKTKMLDAFENQFFTYGELIKELPQYKRTMGEMPLVSIVFNIDQQASDQGLNFRNITSFYQSVARTHENFEVFINAVSRDDVLILECQYNNGLFDQKTISLWLSKFEETLFWMLDNLENDVKHLTLKNLVIPFTEKNENTNKVNVELATDQSILKDTREYESLHKMWREVLCLSNDEEIRFDSNFFHLGGHSLLAIDMALKIEQELKVKVEVKDIFEKPIFGNLVEFLIKKSKSFPKIEHESFLKLKHVDIKSSELSFSQYQAWYLEQLNDNTTMHFLPSAIVVDQILDAKLLEESFRILIDTQPALRTYFDTELGKPVQRLMESREEGSLFNLSVEEYKEKLNEKNEFVIFKAKLDLESKKEIDLKKAPLFRSKLYLNSKNGQSVLFFMPHHLIWDGWSFDIFFKHLDVIYSLLLKGEKGKSISEWKSILAIEDVSYFDFVRDQREKLESGYFLKSINFYKNKYKGSIPRLTLPKALDHQAGESRPLPDGAVVHFELEKELIENCAQFSKNHQISMYVLFLGAYKITLSRYSRASYEGSADIGFREDIIVGTPVRNRKHRELMEAVGFFVNTMVVRSTIDYGESLLRNIENVRDEFYQVLEHDEVPFQVVLNEIKKDHKSFDGELFQTFFSFQDVSNREGLLNGKKYRQINIDKAATHTDLDLWIKASTNKIEGGLEYRPTLIDEKIAHLFVKNFISLLNSIVNEPLKVLRNCGISHAEHTLVKKLNECSFKDDIDIDLPFIKLLNLALEKYKKSPAIEFEEKVISGEELQEKSNAVAALLIQRGVRVGDLVGICLERSENLLIYLLGIMKAGAGYVPLDPKFPVDRLKYMVENSSLQFLITEEGLRYLNLPVKSILIREKDFSELKLTEVSLALVGERLSEISGDIVAYVIYTSGSTGLPKGVAVTQKNVTNFLRGMNELKISKNKDRLLAVTTLSFDIAVLELYLPILNQGTVVMASSYDVMDGKKLLNLIFDKKINLMQATATTWRLLLQSGFDKKTDLTILCGGESFPPDLAITLSEKVEHVFNMYGPTETTVWSTVKKINHAEVVKNAIVTIGKPILNTSVYILDEYLNLLPFGVAGEIYIGGFGLANGYFNRQDLTQERFIFHKELGHRLYRTGDVGRMLPDGELICLGRNDGQVKWRGFRIELGEIESQIMKTGLVYECATVIREVKIGDQRLLGFISLKANGSTLGPKGGESKIVDEIKSILRKNLPHYMVPQSIIILDHLPKTLNGKIDKKSLVFEGDQAHNSPSNNILESLESLEFLESKVEANENISPASKIAGEIDSIWKDILGDYSLTEESNFFESGGNSLLAVELMSKVSHLLQKDLQLKLLLSSPVLKDFKRSLLPSVERGNSGGINQVQPMNKELTQQSHFKSLVEIFNINSTGANSKIPLFVFHGVGGNVLNYISLVPAIANSRSLIAFQSLGLNQDETPHQTIQEMAKFYYLELKKYRPSGPYLLSGGSMGGLLALEVARILKSAGDEVLPVIMFDTFGPTFELKSFAEEKKINIFERIKKSLNYRMKYCINSLIYNALVLLGKKVPLKVLITMMEKINYQSIWKYKANEFNGDIILIRSKMRTSGWYSDPYLGWRKIIKGNIDTHEIDGDHHDFIESPELVTKLRDVLEKIKK